MEEDVGMVDVCTTMSLDAGVTLQRAIIFDVTSTSDSSGLYNRKPFSLVMRVFSF